MIAVIKTGGKQYKVEEGSVIKVEKIVGKEKDILDFDDILNGKKVKASIVKEFKAPKIVVFKFKAKKHYQRTMGHRQEMTEIKIENIK